MVHACSPINPLLKLTINIFPESTMSEMEIPLFCPTIALMVSSAINTPDLFNTEEIASYRSDGLYLSNSLCQNETIFSSSTLHNNELR